MGQLPTVNPRQFDLIQIARHLPMRQKGAYLSAHQAPAPTVLWLALSTAKKAKQCSALVKRQLSQILVLLVAKRGRP